MKKILGLVLTLILCMGVVGWTAMKNNSKEDKKEQIEVSNKEETEVSNDEVSVVGEFLKTDEKHSWFRFTIKNNTQQTFKGKLFTVYKNNGDDKEQDRITIDIDLEPGTHTIQNVKTRRLEQPAWGHKSVGDFSESTAYKSSYYNEEIFKVEGYLTTLFVLVENINENELNDIIKEYKEKYEGNLSTIHFFDKSQNVKIGEDPFKNDIDGKAKYTIGDDKLVIR
ncbi:hypothetical protein [Clostridium sp. UBA6640]|uniref:hypothetical protein n=1 Tax=Clostridium sp. UBA6640 TaxID=1946370 RepID=UPI0025C59F62|nr:hypothetical protein [Clostridium sp. UBA6640]